MAVLRGMRVARVSVPGGRVAEVLSLLSRGPELWLMTGRFSGRRPASRVRFANTTGNLGDLDVSAYGSSGSRANNIAIHDPCDGCSPWAADGTRWQSSKP